MLRAGTLATSSVSTAATPSSEQPEPQNRSASPESCDPGRFFFLSETLEAEFGQEGFGHAEGLTAVWRGPLAVLDSHHVHTLQDIGLALGEALGRRRQGRRASCRSGYRAPCRCRPRWASCHWREPDRAGSARASRQGGGIVPNQPQEDPKTRSTTSCGTTWPTFLAVAQVSRTTLRCSRSQASNKAVETEMTEAKLRAKKNPFRGETMSDE